MTKLDYDRPRKLWAYRDDTMYDWEEKYFTGELRRNIDDFIYYQLKSIFNDIVWALEENLYDD